MHGFAMDFGTGIALLIGAFVVLMLTAPLVFAVVDRCMGWRRGERPDTHGPAAPGPGGNS